MKNSTVIETAILDNFSMPHDIEVLKAMSFDQLREFDRETYRDADRNRIFELFEIMLDILGTDKEVSPVVTECRVSREQDNLFISRYFKGQEKVIRVVNNGIVVMSYTAGGYKENESHITPGTWFLAIRELYEKANEQKEQMVERERQQRIKRMMALA